MKTAKTYNDSQTESDKDLCDLLAKTINQFLPEAENKIWHSHPVWFIDGNPIVGYSKQKKGIRLMFWSGSDFNDPQLIQGTGKFKDASIFYNAAEEVSIPTLEKWLQQSKTIQWDYKNLVKRKGKLERLHITD